MPHAADDHARPEGASDANDAPPGAHSDTGAQATGRGPRNRYTAALAEEIETRWQRQWEQHEAFRAPNPGDVGFDPAKPKFYALDMFPYPSGSGLHVGHPEGYTATDILSRYMRMRGRNVLHPMGWDAFGLPAEQYAVVNNVHPRDTTVKAITTFRRQLKRFGFSYDWSREISTIDPAYYRWTQWIWLRCYHAWYDHRVENKGRAPGRARHIDTLIQDLAKERLLVGPSGELIEPGAQGALGSIGGEPMGGVSGGFARKWIELTEQERKEVVDSRRLAYLGEQTVNWCPALGTVLANEEVIDGRSERGGHPVNRVPMRQWMFRITAYADRLLEDLDLVDWPHSTRTQQAEWIGRSEGAEIDFPLFGPSGEPEQQSLRVFTTRPDTVFGATFMVCAPEHPLVDEITTPGQRASVEAYRAAIAGRSDVDRMESKDKSGVFTGAHAMNPATGERIPVWIADYVLMGYGSGAIMSVPGHDERDYEFAAAHGLPVRVVVAPEAGAIVEPPYAGQGVGVGSSNSEVSLNDLPTPEAKRVIIAWLETEGLGSGTVQYKLRDWLFSRQRYWGEPFPVVYDEHAEPHPLPESALPVVLPDLDDFRPTESDDPKPPLGRAGDWLRVEIDGKTYTRETNTMPNWAGSCWYYLRYCDAHNDERFIGEEAERYWMGGGGVDLYMGGAEHAVLHLLYARFWHKALHDLGFVSTPEPFRKLRHQGLIQSYAYQRSNGSLVPTDEVEERDGVYIEIKSGEPVKQIVAKMSKSLKNVVNPDDVIAEFGADTFRLYEMYMGPIEAAKPWNTRDIIGPFRFLQRVWRLAVDEDTGELSLRETPHEGVERALHKATHKVRHDIENLAFNTAIAAMIQFVNEATGEGVTRDQLHRFVRILAPFAPHICEELWSRLGETGFVSLAPWPAHDEAMLVDDTVEIAVQIKGKVRAKLMVPAGADAATLETLALEHPDVRSFLEGLTVRKVIAVPGRLVNIVAT